MTASVPNGLASHPFSGVLEEELTVSAAEEITAKIAKLEVKVEHLTQTLAKLSDVPQQVGKLATLVEAIQEAQAAHEEREERERIEREQRRAVLLSRAWDLTLKVGAGVGGGSVLYQVAQSLGIL